MQILDGATYRGIVGELVKKSVPSETIAVTDSSWLYSAHASAPLRTALAPSCYDIPARPHLITRSVARASDCHSTATAAMQR
jgi:hypothetical protein